MRKVQPCQSIGFWRVDDLEAATIHRLESGPQAIVPVDNFAKSELERIHVERALQVNCRGDMV